ncbi:secretin N-terminal domain-containing protein [Zoogloea sp.]|uniref:type II secretion system protein GspD n=1 Tax=Zoogloea sp. TaxID=49181 RepID=UPI002610BEFC|nr:secretin N-terminal domain-containing protein [Zoogloea sp.]
MIRQRSAAALLALALLGTGLPPAFAGEPAGPRRISVNLREVPINDVFEMLSRNEKINVLVGKGITGNISVNLYNVSAEDAVRAVAEAGGYIAERRGDTFQIVERKDAGLDGLSGNSVLRTFKVQYSNPKTVADILTKHVSRYGKITPLLERNLIVVEDQPAYVERIAALLEQVDLQPRQILIEAKILEVRLDRNEAFGVDWSKVVGGSNRTFTGGTRGLADRAGSGLFFSVVSDNLNIYLSALASKGRVTTLSTPKLLALENQQAITSIGDQTGYKVTTTINQVTTESIQFLESGVILRVTPSIDERGRILMKIHPEVSTASVNNNIPSKNSTQVNTTLIAEDGQAIFIGGLIRNSSNYKRSGVPVLGEIPVIGAAFSHWDDGGVSTETVVVITPRIIRDDPPDALATRTLRLDDSEPPLLRSAASLEASLEQLRPRD